MQNLTDSRTEHSDWQTGAVLMHNIFSYCLRECVRVWPFVQQHRRNALEQFIGRAFGQHQHFARINGRRIKFLFDVTLWALSVSSRDVHNTPQADHFAAYLHDVFACLHIYLHCCFQFFIKTNSSRHMEDNVNLKMPNNATPLIYLIKPCILHHIHSSPKPLCQLMLYRVLAAYNRRQSLALCDDISALCVSLYRKSIGENIYHSIKSEHRRCWNS